MTVFLSSTCHQPPRQVNGVVRPGGLSLMRSALADWEVTIDPSWLRPAVSVEEYFARDPRHAVIRRRPERRAAVEAEMAEDRAALKAAMEPGDELRPWVHRFDPGGPCGHAGVAVVRAGRVVKAWL